MSDTDNRVQAYFATLESALGGPDEQCDTVLAEVRADLEAQVRDAMAQGTDREEAWAQALDSVGEPAALAVSMRSALPPAPPRPWVQLMRSVLAVLVAGSGLLVIFTWRSADYGFDPLMPSLILGLNLPLALLLWPGVVWRWNPLFSTGTAALALLLIVGLDFGARNSTIESAFGPEGAVPTAGLFDSLWTYLPAVLAGLALLTVVMIQRGGQRRLVLAWTLGLLAAIEAVHQVEEALFRAEAQHAVEWVEARTTTRGALPTSEEFADQYEPRWLSRLHFYTSPAQEPDGAPSFAVFWSRATQNNHELIYHSDGTITGND